MLRWGKRGKKRAQISMFIAVGIILLLTVSLYYASNQGLFEPKSNFPQEASSVGRFVEACLRDVGKQAVVLMGLQSGYINIPEDIQKDENLRITLGALTIPFWHIKGRERIPKIEDMEKELEQEIKENLGLCINDFQNVEDDFEVQVIKDAEIDVRIAKDDVKIIADYVLDVNNKNLKKTSRINRFVVTLPVKLKQAYELASEIMRKENSEMIFENITLDLVSLNPRVPFTGIEFQCSPLSWKLKDIRNDIMNTLYYNLPKVRFKNTNYPAFIEEESAYQKLRGYSQEDVLSGNYPKNIPEDSYDYFHHFLTTENLYPELQVAVNYQKVFGMNLVASPSDNGVLKANYGEGTEKYLQFLCINVYHFTYDIVYPLEITIFDPESFNGEGFIFNFAFPVQIKSNAGNRNVYIPTVFEQPVPYTGYCDNLGQEYYDIRAVGGVPFLDSKLPLKDVNITYNCLKFQCKLGVIETDPECGNCRRLYTPLPTSGQHCFLQAEKAGYVSQELQVLDSTEITFEMQRTREVELEVVKHVKDPEAPETELEEFEIALIMLEGLESSFVSYADFMANESSTIQIIDGSAKYNVSIVVFDTRNNRFLGGYKSEWNKDLSAARKVKFHVIEVRPTPINVQEQFQALNFIETNKEYKQALKPEVK